MKNISAMEDLIVKLLKESGRVIIPDFGALIIKDKSPLTVIFNEFLQYNDGALISSAEKELKIKRDEAVNKVKDYVTDIVSKLDKGEMINLPGIGTLSKSSIGKITLGSADIETPKKTSKTKDVKESTVEFDTTDTKINSATEKPKSVYNETKLNKAEVKEEKVITPSTRKIEKPVEVKKTTPPTDKKNEKQDVEPKESMPISEYYEDNSSRNRLSILIWAAIIILVNGSIFFIFNDELKSFFGSKKQNTENQNISTPSITEEIITIQEDQVENANDNIVIEDTPEEPFDTEQSNTMFTGKKYYVVAGVFKEEANANKLVINLKRKNFNAEKFGRIGTLYAVSFDVFPTKQEADRFMFKIKNEVNSEAWIRIVD